MLLRALAALIVGFFSVSNGVLVFAQQQRVPVIIRFSYPPAQSQAEMVFHSGGLVTRQFRIVPAFAAQLPLNAVEAMRKKPGVAAVELDIEIQAHNDTDVWGVNRVNASAVHSGQGVGVDEAPIPILGTGIRVAVVDTGIDYHHPGLSAGFRGGYDFVNNANSWLVQWLIGRRDSFGSSPALAVSCDCCSAVILRGRPVRLPSALFALRKLPKARREKKHE